MPIRTYSLVVAAAFAMACLAAPEAGAADIYRADYAVSLWGLDVGKSEFETTVDHDTFEIKGSLRSAGLARIFERVDGTTDVSGHVAASGPTPASYDLRYRYGKDRVKRTIAFSGGNVTHAEVDPPAKKRGRKSGKWVEVKPDDLKSVADPLTAVLISAPSPRAVCDRTLRIYDGSTRIDLKLEFDEVRPFATSGFKGTATSCRVRFVPVSGYRRGAFAFKYLSKEDGIRLAFASLGNSGIYVPVFARVGTQIGDVTVRATRFEKMAGKAE